MHPALISDYPDSLASAMPPRDYTQPLTTGLADPEDEDEDDDSDDEDDSYPVFSERLPPPHEPTTAQPGSPEKLAILAERYDRGVDLWHDDDPCFLAEKFPW